MSDLSASANEFMESESSRSGRRRPKVQAHEIDYALHTLGWASFQDLCASVFEVVFDRTVNIYSKTHDGGRDGSFKGLINEPSATHAFRRQGEPCAIIRGVYHRARIRATRWLAMTVNVASLLAILHVQLVGWVSEAIPINCRSRSGWVHIGSSTPRTAGITMNGNRYYGVRVEGAKYGVGFGSALAIAISYTNNHSILWAIIHGILGWLYVIYVALFE